MKKTTILLASLVTATLGLAGPAAAQQPPEKQHSPVAPSQAALPSAEDFSQQQLERFVDTQKQMGQIQQEYSRKLQDHQDKPEQAMTIKKEAQQALASAVQESGLKVQTYNQIIRLAQQDADFRARLQGMM